MRILGCQVVFFGWTFRLWGLGVSGPWPQRTQIGPFACPIYSWTVRLGPLEIRRWVPPVKPGQEIGRRL